LDWKQICGAECIKQTVNPLNPSRHCVGFGKRDYTSCQLVECPIGQNLGPVSNTKRKRGAPPFTVVMADSCFQSLETKRPTPPTTATPTNKPTRPIIPTAAPIPACTVTGLYAPEFKILEKQPAGLEQYQVVTPQKNLCELIRVKPFTPSATITNFQCTPQACIRWCTGDTQCRFAVYSSLLKTCMKAGTLEITDDESSYLPYWDGQYTVYMNKDRPPGDILYFSGKCVEYAKDPCNAHPECEWNKGRIGYNDPTQGGGAGGWCGRVRCLAYDAMQG
jgi:hypothetical protein